MKHGTYEMRTHTMEGRKREERLGELRNMAHHKQGLTNWRGGRGRSGLVRFETWQQIKEGTPTGREEEGGGEYERFGRGARQDREKKPVVSERLTKQSEQ